MELDCVGHYTGYHGNGRDFWTPPFIFRKFHALFTSYWFILFFLLGGFSSSDSSLNLKKKIIIGFGMGWLKYFF